MFWHFPPEQLKPFAGGLELSLGSDQRVGLDGTWLKLALSLDMKQASFMQVRSIQDGVIICSDRMVKERNVQKRL